jgi:thymidylate synthase (FAD)
VVIHLPSDFRKVLDHGFVRLDASLADDLSVVNAARVSLAKKSDWEIEPPYEGSLGKNQLKEADAKLIGFLMKNRHGTPFEHNLFRFHVKCPIFVAREWQRHRISSYNEWSARYSKLEPEFYVPDNVRSQVGKPGAYTFEPVSEESKLFAQALIYTNGETAFSRYEAMIEEGIAKEVARMVLPMNIYTQYYWSVNARSLMNFVSLRNDEHALWEIREFAKAVETLFAQAMPVTYEAFISNGRTAP